MAAPPVKEEPKTSPESVFGNPLLWLLGLGGAALGFGIGGTAIWALVAGGGAAIAFAAFNNESARKKDAVAETARQTNLAKDLKDLEGRAPALQLEIVKDQVKTVTEFNGMTDTKQKIERAEELARQTEELKKKAQELADLARAAEKKLTDDALKERAKALRLQAESTFNAASNIQNSVTDWQKAHAKEIAEKKQADEQARAKAALEKAEEERPVDKAAELMRDAKRAQDKATELLTSNRDEAKKQAETARKKYEEAKKLLTETRTAMNVITADGSLATPAQKEAAKKLADELATPLTQALAAEVENSKWFEARASEDAREARRTAEKRERDRVAALPELDSAFGPLKVFSQAPEAIKYKYKDKLTTSVGREIDHNTAPEAAGEPAGTVPTEYVPIKITVAGVERLVHLSGTVNGSEFKVTRVDFADGYGEFDGMTRRKSSDARSHSLNVKEEFILPMKDGKVILAAREDDVTSLVLDKINTLAAEGKTLHTAVAPPATPDQLMAWGSVNSTLSELTTQGAPPNPRYDERLRTSLDVAIQGKEGVTSWTYVTMPGRDGKPEGAYVSFAGPRKGDNVEVDRMFIMSEDRNSYVTVHLAESEKKTLAADFSNPARRFDLTEKSAFDGAIALNKQNADSIKSMVQQVLKRQPALMQHVIPAPAKLDDYDYGSMVDVQLKNGLDFAYDRTTKIASKEFIVDFTVEDGSTHKDEKYKVTGKVVKQGDKHILVLDREMTLSVPSSVQTVRLVIPEHLRRSIVVPAPNETAGSININDVEENRKQFKKLLIETLNANPPVNVILQKVSDKPPGTPVAWDIPAQDRDLLRSLDGKKGADRLVLPPAPRGDGPEISGA